MTDYPEDDHPLHATINTRLAEIAAESPESPPWYDAWAELGPQSTDRQRLAVYQAVRAAASLPEEAGFFLVAWMLDVLTDERAEEGLRDAEERLEQVRQKYGLATRCAGPLRSRLVYAITSSDYAIGRRW